MRFALFLIGLALAGPVFADDDKPVTCKAAKPYAGDAAQAPDISAAFARGDLTAVPLPAGVQQRLNGQGVMAYAPPWDASVVWVGHSGGAPGVKAVVVYSLHEKAFVAVALTGDGSAEATAALLLRTLK